MDVLTGIKNVLEFINNNWTAIIIIIGLIIAIVKKAKDFFSKSDDEKIEIAKKQIKEIMMKLIADAETDYLSWIEAGAIKRSQVIAQIFDMYPILLKAVNQDDVITWIDDVIDESLKTMREIFAKQTDEEVDEEAEAYDEIEDMSSLETSDIKVEVE